MQKAQIPCHHINYNLQYRPANILWQQNENMTFNDAYNRKNHQIADFNSSTSRINTRKDTPNRHKATNHIYFIQSSYKYNRRANKSTPTSKLFEFKTKRAIHMNIQINWNISWYRTILPFHVRRTKPARQVPESSSIPTNARVQRTSTNHRQVQIKIISQPAAHNSVRYDLSRAIGE